LAAGVAASTVTVFVPALPIVVGSKLELGTWEADQFVATRHKPLPVAVQESEPA
jgi:hypothetical protein